MAPSFGVEVSPLGVRDVGEIERVIAGIRAKAEWGADPRASTLTVINRQLIINLAARRIDFPRSIPIRYFVGGWRADELWG